MAHKRPLKCVQEPQRLAYKLKCVLVTDCDDATHGGKAMAWPPLMSGGCFRCSSRRSWRGAPIDNLHRAAAQHEGGPDHDGVAQAGGDLDGALLAGDHVARGLLDVQARQDLVPLVAVLRLINALGRRPPDLYVALSCTGAALSGAGTACVPPT